MTEASIHFRGNPWSQFGLTSFWFALQGEHPFFSGDPELDAFRIKLFPKTDPESLAQMKEWLFKVLQHRWNEIFWRSPAAKIFNESVTYRQDGFVNHRAAFDLTADMIRKAKGDRNISLEKKELVAWPRDNFIGVTNVNGDVQTIQDRMAEVIDHFVDQLVSRSGKVNCDLCGRQCSKTWNANQYLNPFVSKHHNVQVRGAYGPPNYFSICPECYIINLFATLDRNVPFVRKGSDRHIVLPDIKNLKVLRDVYIRLRHNLIDLRQVEAPLVWTNLRSHWANDKYSLIIALLHNILFKFSDSNGGSWTWDPANSNLNKITPVRWYILPFKRGKSVNFGAITSIKPCNDSYRLIEEIPLDDGRTCIPVADVVSRIRPLKNGCFAASLLSKAVATSNPDVLAKAMVFLMKENTKDRKKQKLAVMPQKGRPHPAILLNVFAKHFLEVTN